VTGGCSGCNALVGSYYAHLGLSDMAILYMTTVALGADTSQQPLLTMPQHA
jgi:hypothetical protein